MDNKSEAYLSAISLGFDVPFETSLSAEPLPTPLRASAYTGANFYHAVDVLLCVLSGSAPEPGSNTSDCEPFLETGNGHLCHMANTGMQPIGAD